MKNTTNHLFKFFIFSFVLLSNFMMYSQTPGDDTAAGDLEGNDAVAAPINSQLIVLALAGVIFAVYTFRNYRKRA
jgi:F0F1-type ATP synthase membrane subunit a